MHVRRSLIALVLLLAFDGRVGHSGARLSCPGTEFAHSCVRRLYRGFDAAGACTRDFSQLFVDGSITDCWANGASARIDGFGRGTGTSMLRNHKGKLLRRGTTTTAADFSAVIQYRRAGRTWRIERAANGDFSVTCPNGSVETYPAATVAAGGCGPIVDCASGTCP